MKHSTILYYSFRRLIALIPVLIGVTFITYGLMYISPKDPVEMMLQSQGTMPAPEIVDSMRHQLGLDRPFMIQYLDWLWRFVHGDMGNSYIDGKSVAGMLLTALPNTLKLTVSSVLVTIAFSVPLGILTAVYQGKPVDIIIRFLSFIGNSLPNFVVSLLLLFFLGADCDEIEEGKHNDERDNKGKEYVALIIDIGGSSGFFRKCIERRGRSK